MEPVAGSFRGESRNPPDQILHLACHFSINEQNTEKSFLRFQSPKGPSMKVLLGELDSELQRLRLRTPQGACTRKALVFANACRASIIDPGAVASLPKIILKYGHIGFIGTETNIPDEVASEFAKRFYKNLLRGHTLGDSVMNAKRELLRFYHNPLGVLYVFYAEPDMRVRKPVDI